MADGSATAPSCKIHGTFGFFWDAVNTGLGITNGANQIAAFSGGGSTTAAFMMIGDGAFANNQTESFNATAASGSTFTMRRARGSLATPAVAALNDAIGNINFQPYRAGAGTGYNNGARIQGKFIETGTVDATHTGMAVEVSTCPIGSGTLAVQLHIEAAYQATLGPFKIGAISAPAASAALDIASTTGALLLPRMTTTQKTALTPTNGMLVYDTTLNKFQGYENGAWVNLV